MAPQDKNPYEYKLPENEDSLLKKYHASTFQYRKPDLVVEPSVKASNALDLETGPMERFIDKMAKRCDRIAKRFIDDVNSDHPPSIPKQFVYLGKMAFYTAILFPALFCYVVLAIFIIPFHGGKGIISFIGAAIRLGIGVGVLGAVKILSIIVKLHMIYTMCVLALLVVAVAYIMIYNVIYNPYISSAPTEDLHLKTPDGKTAHITNNRSATDVTYKQLLQFLEQDDTDSTLGKYQITRVSAAVRLHDNAEKQGIRAGVAEVNLDNSYASSYCWNVFETTDQGTVYVSAFHPVLTENSDSLIYIPRSGVEEGQIYFIPVNTVINLQYDSLTEDMGKNAISGRVTGINVIW